MSTKIRPADERGAHAEYLPPPPPSTECKHGQGSCSICGTTDRRDRLHTTHNGKGVVGRLKKR